MISKDELVKVVAQNCGISVDVSEFFFEVFVNRLSNKLKPGDLLHFHSHGYFHKRNCRIQLGKSQDSPTAKSYLIQLILFSEELKVNNDLGSIHFLKIANLKTLWVDDKDFQKSLAAGDFAPHSDRNQLIKAFATKAEVIIAGLRKDYDSELVEELIIPITFDLNFLLKTSQKNKVIDKTISDKKTDSDNTRKTPDTKIIKDPEKTVSSSISKQVKESSEKALPWNYGNKFLEKDKKGKQEEISENVAPVSTEDKASILKKEIELRKEKEALLKDFEPVASHLTSPKEEVHPHKDDDTVKFSVSKNNDDDSDNSTESNTFTEVKSKTEAFRFNPEYGKNKKGYIDKYSLNRVDRGSRGRLFGERRNFLPFVFIFTFIVIAGVVVYLYFIKSDSKVDGKVKVIHTVPPLTDVNIIERDYEFAVTFPYPKKENRDQMSGYSKELFNIKETKPEIKKEIKPEVTSVEKSNTKTETIVDKNIEPVTETKTEPIIQENKNEVSETKKDPSNRIFLYRNFYVVYVGTFKSEEAANREADRYFDMGYNAIIEEVEGRNRAREYKLSVGDFTSEEFARQFEEKYIK
jgi:nucleoid DNA-binding protein